MIFIFGGIFIVSIIVFIILSLCKCHLLYSPIKLTCLYVMVIMGSLLISTILLFTQNITLVYEDTINVTETTIENYVEVNTSKRNTGKNEIYYTYTIKDSNDKKTVSIKDDNVYLITTISTNKSINHLTKKKISYFNWATFLTTEKYEYVFISK